MLNPKYPIKQLLADILAMVDSGAFQDVDDGVRLLPWTALERQLRFIRKLRFYLNNHDWMAECLFIYDQMAGVDEAVVNGKKVKVRGTPDSAARAVEETLWAAQYYSSQREEIAKYAHHLGFVGQGIDPDQYEGCVRAMLPLMQSGDYFGFGGFCIWGRMPKRITPIAEETIKRVIPILWGAGIRRFHLLGVQYAPAIEWVADLVRWINEGLAEKDHITFSTDGSAPETSATIAGRISVQGRQTDGGFRKEHKYKEYHPCDLAMQNIRDYHEWVSAL